MDKRNAEKATKKFLEALEIKPTDKYYMIDLKTVLKKQVLLFCKENNIKINS